MHYNGGRFGQFINLPHDDMPAIRPNPQSSDLTLDEQSFESLLSAAFTIQEHNKRRKDSGQEPTTSPVELVPQEKVAEAKAPPAEGAQNVPATKPLIVCPHCGSPKNDESSDCSHCGLGEFRPGERLQRNWASMWLKSQAQGLWPERSVGADESVRKIGEVAHRDPAPVPAQITPQNLAEQELAEDAETTHSLVFPFMKESKESSDLSEISEAAPREEIEPIADETREIEVHPLALSTQEAFHNGELAEVAAVSGDALPTPLLQRLSELQVRLRFHRADIYLCLAVLVALSALLWPAAASPKRAALTPWQRALVTLGIAEAPAPVIHLQGDPAIEVWVDPHTALYYCPGAEPYGKTADGRFSSQHDAQMDRFEPATRSVCE